MLRLRQLALAATQRDPVIEELRAFLAVPLGYIDPGVGAFGLENRLLVVGDDHLEVVSPVEENTTAGRWIDRQGGDAGYMVIFQCDNLAARREHFADLGVRTVWTSDRPEAIASHLHPKDVQRASPAPPRKPWRPAGALCWKRPLRNTKGCPASPSTAIGSSLKPGRGRRSWVLTLRCGLAMTPRPRPPSPGSASRAWPRLSPKLRGDRPRRYSPGPRWIQGPWPRAWARRCRSARPLRLGWRGPPQTSA
jgi:hypothetical protein